MEEHTFDTNDPQLHILYQPKPKVGYYKIGGPEGFGFYLEERPNKLHRFFTRLLLGWKWIDNKNK